MWVLCVVEQFFDREQDQTMCRVIRPLQVFAVEEDAERVCELFWPFYDDIGEPIRVVESDKLDAVFR